MKSKGHVHVCAWSHLKVWYLQTCRDVYFEKKKRKKMICFVSAHQSQNYQDKHYHLKCFHMIFKSFVRNPMICLYE